MTCDLAQAREVTALLVGRLGDLIVAGPFLRALRAAAPRARLRLVASAGSGRAAALLPGLDETLFVEPYWRPAANLRLAAALASRPCDLLVDLNPSPSRTASALTALCRAPRKAAFRKGRWDRLYTDHAAAPGEREHMLERYARLAALLGIAYEPRLELRLDPADERAAAELMSGRPRLLVHAGNFKKYDNRWPEDKFVELGGRLQAAGRELAFLAGPGEEAPVRAIAGRLRLPAPVLGPFPVGLTAAVLKRADLLLGNITGTTHLAAAVGTPVFGLYAGYTHAVWRPLSPIHGGVVSAQWESCRGISVDEACESLTLFLSRRCASR